MSKVGERMKLIEAEFAKFGEQRAKLVEQIKQAQQQLNQVTTKMTQLQGAYAELGLLENAERGVAPDAKALPALEVKEEKKKEEKKK